MQGGVHEVGYMRWVTRGGLREIFHSLIFINVPRYSKKNSVSV